MNTISGINRAIERGHYGTPGAVLTASRDFWNDFWGWDGAPPRSASCGSRQAGKTALLDSMLQLAQANGALIKDLRHG